MAEWFAFVTEEEINLLVDRAAVPENTKNSILYAVNGFVSFPQKRNGIVFSSGVNYLHSDL